MRRLYDEIMRQYGKSVAKSAMNDLEVDLRQDPIFARIKRLTNARLATIQNKSRAELLQDQPGPEKQTIGEIIQANKNVDDTRNHMQGIVSTAIKSVALDPTEKIAYVTFQGGDKEYAYPNVNEMRAGSKGGYYNRVIKQHSVDGYTSEPDSSKNYITMIS